MFLLERVVMWIYWKDSEGLYHVGYFLHNGMRESIRTFEGETWARAEVHYLNGGSLIAR